MRLTTWLALILFAATSVIAQRGTVGRAGSGQASIVSRSGLSRGGRLTPAAPQRGIEFGLPPLQPIPPLGPYVPRRSTVSAPLPFFGYYPFPLVGVYEPGFPTIQNVVVVAQPVAPAPVSEPGIEPARSSIRDYTWTDKDPGAVTAESPPFAIVLQGGLTHDATAVWIEDSSVGFVDPEGRHGRLRLADVDRESTARLNRVRQLRLQLPPPPRSEEQRAVYSRFTAAAVLCLRLHECEIGRTAQMLTRGATL